MGIYVGNYVQIHKDFVKDKLDMKIVAEDLGVVDEGIQLLMEQVQYPGMKILQFGFDGSDDKRAHHQTYVVPSESEHKKKKSHKGLYSCFR